MRTSACIFVSRQIVVLVVLLQLLVVGISPSLAQSNTKEPMLYFFTSAGCAPCIQVKHNVNQLAAEGYPVTTIDVNERPDWANSFRVTRTPTVALVTDGNVVAGIHPGQIRVAELKEWFRRVGYSPRSRRPMTTKADIATPAQDRMQPRQTKVSLASRKNTVRSNNGFNTPTMHQGTDRPANAAEALALSSTVRIRVEDGGGSSYATGTAIHQHQGETLVMTCGHVFRESKGKGKITAEFGFHDGNIKNVAGQLLDYDAGADDIALIVIQNGAEKIQTVNLANSDSTIQRGDRVFSLGCDNGDAPTIRNTAIKNLALYDGSLKYDIFGRPVSGRSGGGLFNDRGELVGICNAAAVEVDEGVYTALEIMHKEIAKTNLDHLFNPVAAPAAQPPAQIAARNRSDELVPIRRPDNRERENFGNAIAATRPPARGFERSPGSQVQNVSFEQAVSNLDSDKEVLITIRSKSNPRNSRTIVISDPTPKLLDYLGNMSNGQPSDQRSLNVASYREHR